MAVLRKNKKSDFTVIDNTIFRNKGLSLKAKGMLCLLLSLPDNWQFSVAGLVTLSTDGKSAVTSTLKELEEAGYFYKEQCRNNGNFGGTDFIVSETPMSEKPSAENPSTGNPSAENRAQYNTKELNTKELNTKEISISEYEKEFDTLWELYPRKQGKKKALEHYIKARKDGTTYEEVEQGIFAYARLCRAEQREERYIKYASTFFSQKSWLDDFTVTVNAKPKSFIEMAAMGWGDE